MQTVKFISSVSITCYPAVNLQLVTGIISLLPAQKGHYHGIEFRYNLVVFEVPEAFRGRKRAPHVVLQTIISEIRPN